MGDTPSADNALTDRLLRSWLRCRRKAWLDRHGNPAKRRWTAHRILLLDDQQRCFVALLPRKPGHGIAACAAGAEAVVGLRLKGLGPSAEPLEAHPPLLRRVTGQSRWGDFAYQPVLARQGRRTTREHQLPLTLMALLLEQIQQEAHRQLGGYLSRYDELDSLISLVQRPRLGSHSGLHGAFLLAQQAARAET